MRPTTPLWAILIVATLCVASPTRADEFNPVADKLARLSNATGTDAERIRADLIAGGMPAHAALLTGPAGTWPLRLELRRAIRATRDAAARKQGLLVHEWGAIAYQQGFDSAKLDWGEERADLPAFAQTWGQLAKERRNGGEPGERDLPGVEIIKKPIVYFYSDRPETVTFEVVCGRGLFTAWGPPASKVEPEPGSGEPADLIGSQVARLVWRNFDLQPTPAAGATGPATPEFPPAPNNAWWWPICRDTDSTPLNVNGTWEKFLFYRGAIAGAPPAITVDGGEGQKYSLVNSLKREPVKHVLAINVAAAGGKVGYCYVDSIAPGAAVSLDLSDRSTDLTAATVDQARERLADLLEAEGLFPKEAAGMSRVWQKAWLETPGVRVLYFNPPAATGALLPIRVDPRPAQTVRTLLVSVECLKDSRENVVQKLVEQLGNGNFGERESAQRQLIELGTTAEKTLREALRKTDDEEVRGRIATILRRINPDPTDPNDPKTRRTPPEVDQ